MARAARLPHLRVGILLLIVASAVSFVAFTNVLAGSASVRIPAQALPGQSIEVQGKAFPPNQSGSITYDGQVIEAFQSNPSGMFTATVTIPLTATIGTGRISAKTASGDLLATATLQIVSSVPSQSAAPSSSDAPSAGPSDTGGSAAGIPKFDHVYVIVFENHEYSSIVNSSAAPYINSLISTYGVSTSFYGEQHPSQPNYLDLVSGSTQGVNDDNNYEFTGANLFHQITLAGRNWHAYEQGYPGKCFTGAQSPAIPDGPGLAGTYRRAHDPAVSFTNVNNYPSECAKITSLAGFDPAAADFELIVPNNMNSMHDGTISNADNFLRALLPQITSSPAFTNSVAFITFDEGTSNTNGGGQVATIAIPSDGRAAWDPAKVYSHASILRTVEQAWGFPLLGDAAVAPPVLFESPTGTPTASPTESATPTDSPTPTLAATDSPTPTPTDTPTASPTDTPTASPTPSPTPTASPSLSPTPSPTPPWPAGATASRMDLLTPCSDTPDCYVYVVRGAGQNGSSVNDELTSLARFFGVPVSGVYSLNPGLTTPLVPGSQLRIPPPTR